MVISLARRTHLLVADLLREVRARATLAFTTHRPSMVRAHNRFALLHRRHLDIFHWRTE